MRTWNDSVAKKCTDVTLGRMMPPTRRISTSESPEHENRLPCKEKKDFAYVGEEAAWDGRWRLIIRVAPNVITRVLIRGTQEGQKQVWQWKQRSEWCVQQPRMQAPLEAGTGEDLISPGASRRSSPAHTWILAPWDPRQTPHFHWI